MPTQPDLSPWPALIEAAKEHVPVAPGLPSGFEFQKTPKGKLRMVYVDRGKTTLIPDVASWSVLIGWAIQTGAWWERMAPMARDFTIDANRVGWSVIVNVIPSARECRSLVKGPTTFNDLLPACAAAIGAIVGADHA